jgi:hypothetical protein
MNRNLYLVAMVVASSALLVGCGAKVDEAACQAEYRKSKALADSIQRDASLVFNNPDLKLQLQLQGLNVQAKAVVALRECQNP